VAERALEAAAITVNKYTIPYDPNPPLVASGIRLGTPALTSRDMRETEMDVVGGLIAEVLKAPEDEAVRASVRTRVRALCERFPLYDALT
jgi:glycine hydroxymethyltransferase